MNQTSNGIVIGLLFVVGIVYDVIAYVLWGNNGTLSKAMQQIGLNWPIVIFAYGGLSAHFFCPNYGQRVDWRTETMPVLALVLGWISFRILWPQGIQ